MDDLVSFASGVALFTVSVLVIIAYWPRRHELNSAAGILGLAIFLSFFADAANTLYWQVFAKVGLLFDIDRTTIRITGNYLDVFFKGGAALAGYLHLRALWLRIDEEKRDTWRWFEMPWYPERRQCLRMLTDFLRKGQ